MEPNIDQLRKNYEQLDDQKLIQLATEKAPSLRPEALNLLKKLIKERGLPDTILAGIDAQFKEIKEVDLLEYTELIRKLPCPICNSAAEKLNATMTGTVTSFIVMTHYKKELIIACPNCLDEQNKLAIRKSALFGWWGFPWGIINTIQALMFNSRMKKQNRQSEANDLLNDFVVERIGRIEASRNNVEELKLIIKYIR